MERTNREGYEIEILAGAIAEGMCEDFGDNRDPAEVAKAALDAYADVNLKNPRPSTSGIELPHQFDRGIKIFT